MKRSLLLPLLAIAVLCVAPHSVAAPSDHSKALLSMLRGIDSVPTAEAIRSTTRTPETSLRRVAEDETLSQYTRRRATSLLSLFPGKKAARHLRELAKSTSERVRWVATYTFVRMHGKSAPSRARTYAKRALTTADAGRREAAIRGLRHVPGAATERLIDRHAKVEKTRRVLDAIRRHRETRSR